MKHFKRAAVLCALSGLLLCGCQGSVQDEPTPYDDSALQQQLQTSATKIAYYEELVGTMQEQVLDLKSALYASRAEYDALYALYQASQAEPDLPSSGSHLGELPYRYVKGEDSVTIIAYTGKGGEVTVPDTVEGLPVRALGDRAFSYCIGVTEIVLPEGLESIGWFAFSGCVDLAEITIPASVTTISYGAFENCGSNLTVRAARNSYAYQYAQSYGIHTTS